MRVLLTGASGFIGSAFYSRYRNILDIEVASFHKEIDQINIDHIDVVVHLAALVHQIDRKSVV